MTAGDIVEKVFFAVLYWFALYFGALFIGGFVVGGLAGAKADGRPAKDAAGKNAGEAFAKRYRQTLFIGAIVIALAGVYSGFLPTP